MKTFGYVVAILDKNEMPYKFYDGTGYTEDANKARLFSGGEVAVARSEQGNHQRLTINEEVRLIKFEVNLPFDQPKPKEETPKPATVETAPANDTLDAQG